MRPCPTVMTARVLVSPTICSPLLSFAPPSCWSGRRIPLEYRLRSLPMTIPSAAGPWLPIVASGRRCERFCGTWKVYVLHAVEAGATVESRTSETPVSLWQNRRGEAGEVTSFTHLAAQTVPPARPSDYNPGSISSTTSSVTRRHHRAAWLPPAEHQVVEPRPTVPVEGHDLAVEHEPRGQGVEQALETPQPIAVLRQHPAGDGVGPAPEAVELQLEQPPIAVERLLAADGDDRLHGPGNRAKRPAESRAGKPHEKPAELCGCRDVARGLGGTPVSPAPHAAFARPRLLAQPGSLLTGSSLEVPGSVPLGMDPDERRRASALLAPKSNIADEGVPADASAVEE